MTYGATATTERGQRPGPQFNLRRLVGAVVGDREASPPTPAQGVMPCERYATRLW